MLKVLDTGPITNHVNIVRSTHGQFAYVTVGGLNQVKVFRTDDYSQVATIDVGALSHGIWPSGDGTRVYVGLENADGAAVIDTLENKLIATIPTGQGPQGVAYVPGAVPEGPGTQNLVPLGVAANTVQLSLGAAGGKAATPGPSSQRSSSANSSAPRVPTEDGRAVPLPRPGSGPAAAAACRKSGPTLPRPRSAPRAWPGHTSGAPGAGWIVPLTHRPAAGASRACGGDPSTTRTRPASGPDPTAPSPLGRAAPRPGWRRCGR